MKSLKLLSEIGLRIEIRIPDLPDRDVRCKYLTKVWKYLNKKQLINSLVMVSGSWLMAQGLWGLARAPGCRVHHEPSEP